VRYFEPVLVISVLNMVVVFLCLVILTLQGNMGMSINRQCSHIS